MTCKNVSHCLQVLARNKLLQEMHAFHIFQLREKNLQAFSVLMWDITKPNPCRTLAGNASFVKIPKHLCFNKPVYTNCHPKLSSVSNAWVSVLFEDLTYRLSLSAYENHLRHFLLTSYTSSHSVGFLLKVTLDCSENDVILLCAADVIMRTESA